MLANAAVTIMVLRSQLNSSLPVELVHFGEAELDGPAADVIRGGPHTPLLKTRPCCPCLPQHRSGPAVCSRAAERR